uniref:Uncharacterized protein n=1 Tax=Electrophorus electricus TaxID=8005 RepID=A0A4W4FUH5_ELEEL
MFFIVRYRFFICSQGLDGLNMVNNICFNKHPNRLDHNALRREVARVNNQRRSNRNANLPINSIPANFETIRNTMAQGKVAQDTGVIAAIPQMVMKNKPYTHHSEYRVLNCLNNVLNNNMCVIVYTHFSPCTSKCLDSQNNNNNIYVPLENVFNRITPGYKAFVYSTIFHYDQQHQTTQSMFQLLMRITAVPIYCCYEVRNGVYCEELKESNAGHVGVSWFLWRLYHVILFLVRVSSSVISTLYLSHLFL